MPPSRVCRLCGQEFVPTGRHWTCPACRENKGKRAKAIEESRECDLCGKRYVAARRGTVTTDKNGRTSMRSSRYCSEYCANRTRSVRSYGLTNDEFRAMVKDRKCNLCQRKMLLREYNIDHDHGTGETHGPVCSACNMMLAVMRRNPITAFRTIEFLTNPPARMVRGEPVYITEQHAERLARNNKRTKSKSFRKVYRS